MKKILLFFVGLPLAVLSFCQKMTGLIVKKKGDGDKVVVSVFVLDWAECLVGSSGMVTL